MMSRPLRAIVGSGCPTVVGVGDPDGGFFHLVDAQLTDQRCQGTACFVARHLDPERFAEAEASTPRIYCLGKCYRAPASASDGERPHVEVAAPAATVLERVAGGGARDLADYTRLGGYQALEQALRAGADAVLAEVEASGLRGRGGAGFPTGRKWRAVRDQPAVAKYVVCNADEGDAGAYIDRFVLEDDPHCVLEALAIAGVTVGATTAYVYVRAEYPAAFNSVRGAVDEARTAGVLGERILGGGPRFDVQVVRGAGSYVCGEETALLNAIEGRRPEVRVRPPYPFEHGLFGQPTLVNNVETLAAIPWIVAHGGEAYASLGAGESRGTKVVSLNSLFRRPGLYEVEFGVSVRSIVEGLGGGPAGGELRGVLIGGPLAGVLPPQLLDTPFTFEDLRRVGCGVGHGGVVAFDEHTSLAELVHHVFRFGAYESCGKCTPCRVGAAWVEELFAAACGRAAAMSGGRARWRDVAAALEATSLCGHGTGLGDFANSVIAHYGGELAACFE